MEDPRKARGSFEINVPLISIDIVTQNLETRSNEPENSKILGITTRSSRYNKIDMTLAKRHHT